ncbi:hypothetical protein JW887_03250 [Candidatus Dojkabacteria bacterium]|nr:hypothetical protein [Candidatus Dojkabacteria bacterium]
MPNTNTNPNPISQAPSIAGSRKPSVKKVFISITLIILLTGIFFLGATILFVVFNRDKGVNVQFGDDSKEESDKGSTSSGPGGENNDDEGSDVDQSKFFEIDPAEPLTDSQIEEYYQKGEERYVVFYFESDSHSEEEFIDIIQPYVKLYIAYSEYQIERYEEVFKGDNPYEVTSLGLSVYESWDDIDPNGEMEYRYLVGVANPFTLSTKCFFGYDDPNFNRESVIQTAMHESIHLLQYCYEQGTVTSIFPKWYKEGMAEGLSFDPDRLKKTYPELFENYEYPDTLAEVEENLNNSDLTELRRSYMISVEFFEFLVDKSSLTKHLTLLSSKKYEEFNSNFEDLYHGTPEELYDEFKESR